MEETLPTTGGSGYRTLDPVGPQPFLLIVWGSWEVDAVDRSPRGDSMHSSPGVSSG